MKTLKYQLLAASMFACTAAFAQTAPPAPAHAPLVGTPNSGPIGSAGQSRDSYQNQGNTNDAVVQQSRSAQYATVDQIAGNSGNTADVYQLGNDVNNASIKQNSTNSLGYEGRNIARIDQFGQHNTSDQSQTGGGNKAYSVQASNATYSSTSQTQTGQGNDAYIRQSGGTNNYASQTQGVEGINSAEIIQENTSNSTAIQTQQSGQRNTASTMQNGAASYSRTDQFGSQNQAFVNQR